MIDTPRFQRIVFALLALVTLVTRSHSLSPFVHLPETALASFFVLGFFVPRTLAFAALFALTFAIDVVVIRVFGQSDFCFTAAYAMLVPAYGVMWLAGRWMRERAGLRPAALPAIALVLVGATFASHLLSSGGFYFLSGRFDAPTLSGFLPRIARYYPPTLLATLVWAAATAGTVTLLLALRPDLRQVRAR